jgi:L-threonylcarbamoyladenylate synthase
VKRVAIDEVAGCGAAGREIAEALRSGPVAAIPTESSYALAADPRSARGVGRVLAIKGRDADKPLLVVVAGREQLGALGVEAPPERLDRLFALWPAALTAILPIRAPLPATLGRTTLAVRVPAQPELRALLEETGPMTATSLNRAGEPPCDDPDEAMRLFEGEVDLLVDGGRTPGGPPSTLLDATVDPPRVLRVGAFPWPPAGD